jgi:hypothetical protein
VKTPTPFNVNSTGWTAYTVQTVCRTIRVSEVGQAGTTDYFVAAPTTDDGPRKKLAGQVYEVTHPNFFQPGDIPFYLKTDTGSVNFDAEEL